ncbi:hypothetical protein GCM10007159_04110 [Modicisalibacter luteus]|nr:hypothetical protein GCM10007159_04110 [Halomonas lutea]
MMNSISFRNATRQDLETIVQLADDPLGSTREDTSRLSKTPTMMRLKPLTQTQTMHCTLQSMVTES